MIQTGSWHTLTTTILFVLSLLLAPNRIAAGAAEFPAGNREFFRIIGKRSDVDLGGVLDVVVHGGPQSVLIRDGLNVNHRVLAKAIQNNPQFTGQPIRLLSCNTGSCPTGFAQNLSNKLNVPVKAPNKFIFGVEQNGRFGHVILGGRNVGGNIVPNFRGPGKFIDFTPFKP